MKSFLRSLYHFLRGFKSEVVFWEVRDGRVMRGDKCECGETHGIRPIHNLKFKPGRRRYP